MYIYWERTVNRVYPHDSSEKGAKEEFDFLSFFFFYYK